MKATKGIAVGVGFAVALGIGVGCSSSTRHGTALQETGLPLDTGDVRDLSRAIPTPGTGYTADWAAIRSTEEPSRASSNSTLLIATTGLAHAIEQTTLADVGCGQLCGAVFREQLHPFRPDWSSNSDGNLARIESEAVAGNADAVDAFLILAAGRPDYVERSHSMLSLAAARGSTLALVTLAERASVGYGFARPSAETAAMYEYLAWTTGNWSSNAEDLDFRPTLAGKNDIEVCRQAIAAASPLVEQSRYFRQRTMTADACR